MQIKSSFEITSLINQNLGPKLNQQIKLKQKEQLDYEIYSQDCVDDKNICQKTISLNDQNKPKLQENKPEIKHSNQIINQKQQQSFIKKKIFGFRVFRKSNYLKYIRLDLRQKQKIEQQIYKDLNIFEFYKDLIFLKKAIMMLLTQDQLASMYFIGFSSSLLNQKQAITDIQSDKLNYYEQQTIVNSEDLQNYYIYQFIERCSNREKMSEIDKRILNSIIQIYFK
ncbi:hypothetical protein ABPG72_006563 [Tetrahymena utriculariae]